MALTPHDVENVTFTTGRLRPGYAADEVDEFLERVGAEIARLTEQSERLAAENQRLAAENEHLRRLVQQAEPAAGPVASDDTSGPTGQTGHASGGGAAGYGGSIAEAMRPES